MKYAILVGDGMADLPIAELGNKTPLEAANTPNLDFLAKNGKLGMVSTIPSGMAPGSDVANLSVLGYDPEEHYCGRAPLEAANMGVELGKNDVCFRCNLVTVQDNIMQDHSAGHITTAEANEIIATLKMELSVDGIEFYPGVSYRHLMVWKDGKEVMECTPPHDIRGQQVNQYLPRGDASDFLRELMDKSKAILENHPVNIKRVEAGKSPATMIWLWGQGKAPKLPNMVDKYQISGGVISAVDLLKGIGRYAGLKVVDVPGATGFLDTNYVGKVEAALEILEKDSFVFVHIEAPDETGHQGDLKAKIQAIEDFDAKVVGPILAGMKKFKDYKLMVLPDHPTPISIKTHTSDPVPFIIYTSDENTKSSLTYSESNAQKTGVFIEKGYKLINMLIDERDAL